MDEPRHRLGGFGRHAAEDVVHCARRARVVHCSSSRDWDTGLRIEDPDGGTGTDQSGGQKGADRAVPDHETPPSRHPSVLPAHDLSPPWALSATPVIHITTSSMPTSSFFR